MTLLTADFSDGYRDRMTRTYWPNRTLLSYFDEAVAAHPDRVAVIGHVDADRARHSLTYRELAERADRIAAGLLDLGIRPGQVVSIQLPNWWQLVALHLGCLRVGAVTNALMSIFRRRELEFMLGLAESVVFVAPETFNGFDHGSLAAELGELLPALQHVVKVRPDGGGDVEERLLSRTPTAADRAEFARRAPGPDDVTQLAYTSATTGEAAPVDAEGRLQLRADSLFGGYLKRPDLRGLDHEGWFDTGDLARIDADGYLRITGRSKDIIIRGGENIPVVEIENLIYSHPGVAEVALVAMPDPRLGERACAFVVAREGAGPTLDDLTAHLRALGTATQYLPERLELVDALPRTLTGKIQKFKLREILNG